MPNDVSAILALPYIQPSQAQKHVSHNEALRKLDLLVQLVVSSRQLSDAPALPEEGERYIVPAGASGTFLGQDGRIGLWEAGSWSFIDALPGWRAEVRDESRSVVFDGSSWVGPEAMVMRVLGLGVATDSDSVNRLAVAAEATLLTHIGAGHQVKINKAAASDTASLVFQTNWSGRAEMGTAGSDAFAIKTSADGSSFQTALKTQTATGRVELPAGSSVKTGSAAQPGLAFLGDEDTGLFSAAGNQIGFAVGGAQAALLSATALTLAVPVGGTAVTQTATDTTAGRLLKTGDFGLGTAITLGAGDNLDTLPASGLYYNSAAGNTSGNNYPIASAGAVLNIRRSATNWVQRFSSYPSTSLAAQVRLFERSYGASGWSPWVELFHQGTVLGTVSQAAGVPTGRVIERGSNANGDYVRFADGTQICTFAATAVACQTTQGALFMTATLLTWTYPAAFAAGSLPVVGGMGGGTARFLCPSTPGVTTVDYRVLSAFSDAATLQPRLVATGRWF